MRFKTLVLIPLIAVLATTIHNKNVSEIVHLPISQSQTSANAPQKIKLEQISPEVKVEEVLTNRKNNKASRNRTKTQSENVTAVQGYAKQYMAEQYGWGEDHFECLVNLWNRESGWRYNADNPTSSAYGIPQALPGSKMSSAGADWKTNPETQIRWGLNYIDKRYKTPCGAWGAFKKKGWY
ncbi:MAG: hypothetical protein RL621_1393 [Bacteroidota bacterium]|jgi:hypothetical protein